MDSNGSAVAPPRGVRYLAAAAAAVVVAVIAATPAAGAGLDHLRGVHGSYVPVADLVAGGGIVVIALVVLWARPAHAVGWLMLAFAALGAVQHLTEAYGVRAQAELHSGLPFGRLALSLGGSLWIPAVTLPATLLLNRYPDGLVTGRFWAWVNKVAVGAMVVAVLAAGTDQDIARQDFSGARTVLAVPPPVARGLLAVAAAALLLCALVSIGGAAVRTWRARAPQRQQLLLLLVTAAAVVALAPLDGPGWGLDAGLVAVAAAAAVGVLRYRLPGAEVVIRRALPFAALTLLVVGVYAAADVVTAALVPGQLVPRVAAAAAVALILLALRDRLQAWADRLVYGARDDPPAAIRPAGAPVPAGSPDPLPAMVDSVAGAVRASFVSVTDTDGAVLAATGTQRPEAGLAYPLTAAGVLVGLLGICPARGERALPAADARLVDTLIAPVAAIVHARQLTRRLAAAHDRVLAAAGEERSRIRRDLHDGLGPSLSGVALGLEALQAQLPGDAAAAAALTARMRTEVASAVEDVRRIIDELRPAALEDVGLVQALRDKASSLSARSSGVVVDVCAGPLPGLPEQVEIAAFRIAEEALNNVLRHARASRCEVRLEAGEALVMCISDNGVGLPPQTRPGAIGLASMRQRAADLGGACTVGPADPSGVIVSARLPLAVPL